jgi:mRNA interferase RelE/StbE
MRSGGCWVSGDAYELVLGAAARRALTDRLPEAVATAVVNFVTSALVQEPYRVGKPLRGELAGLWSARVERIKFSTASTRIVVK